MEKEESEREEKRGERWREGGNEEMRKWGERWGDGERGREGGEV